MPPLASGATSVPAIDGFFSVFGIGCPFGFVPNDQFVFDEFCRDQRFASHAIPHEEFAVARGLRDELARLAIDRGIENHGRLSGIPVVGIVRRGLEVPRHFAGIGIQCDQRTGVEIISGAIGVCDHRLRIAGGDVDQFRIGIIRDGHPRHAATVRGHFCVGPGVHAGIALFLRHSVEAPLQVAGFGIVRFEVAADVGIVAADACYYVIADDGGRDGYAK